MDDVNQMSDKENGEENITMNLGLFQMSNKKLGKGVFGTVYLGIHKETKENVAIKEIRKKEIKIYDNNGDELENEEIIENKELMYSDLLKQEIQIIEKLYHPYIFRMLYKINFNEDCYIISEYLSGQDYFHNNNLEITEEKVCKIFCQILSAIEYLHKNYIVHRDIKLENILFDDDGDAKLIDFGFSKYIKNDEYIEGFMGSKLYAAPEMIFSEEKYNAYLTDIWSLGICIYTMLFTDFPFFEDENNTFYDNLRTKELSFPDNIKVSDACKDLLKKILEKNPRKRIYIDQIKKHPWLKILDYNFMKSPGVSLSKDIIPVDLEVVREMGLNDEKKIKKIIKDILTNSHNKNTCSYYLKIDIKKRKNLKSVADLRPTSDLFINYINSEKSKLKYYNNDLNKVCEEMTKTIMEQIKKETQEEQIAFGKIKNLMEDGGDKIKSENKNLANKNNKNDIKNKEIVKKRSRSFGKLSVLKKYLKEDNNNKGINRPIIKVNKIKMIDKLISPVIFVHSIIDDIIIKALSSIKDSKENKNDFQIEIEQPNNERNSKKSEIEVTKNNNFTINLIEEFVYLPEIKNADKTVSFGFYKPKTKINKFQTIETEITNKNNKGKLFDKKFNKKNKIEAKNLNHNKYINHSSTNIKYTEKNKMINVNKKIEPNKNTIKNKNSFFNNIKNKVTNAVTSIKNKFSKRNIINHGIQKQKNKPKPKKRSNSYKIISKTYLNKLFNDEDIKIVLSKKRAQSYKKCLKSMKSSKNNEKKLEKKAEKFINKVKYRNSEKINNKNLDKNLNINELISERNSGQKKTFLKNKNKKNLTLSKSFTLISSPRKYPPKKKLARTNTQENNNISIDNNANKTNNPIITKKTKIAGKTYLIYKSNKKKNYTISNNRTNFNNSSIRNRKINGNESTPIKTSIFTNNNNSNVRKPKAKINKSSRQKNKDIDESINRNKSTIDTSSRKKSNIDTSSRKKSNIDNDTKMKTQRNSINKKIRAISIDKKSILKNEEEKKYKLEIKKDINLAKEIIVNYLGEDNTTVTISKTGIKFAGKIFFGKNKIDFKLNLIQSQKNKCTLNGELIKGEAINFEKVILKLKEKLK